MKDVPFKKITVILKYRSASRDSKTDYRAMKAIPQRKGSWYPHQIPGYDFMMQA